MHFLLAIGSTNCKCPLKPRLLKVLNLAATLREIKIRKAPQKITGNGFITKPNTYKYINEVYFVLKSGFFHVLVGPMDWEWRTLITRVIIPFLCYSHILIPRWIDRRPESVLEKDVVQVRFILWGRLPPY